jgi:ubiquinone/menaquinone biosynthesis C-methylase UbiE
LSSIPREFTAEYYDEEYFVGRKGGKRFRRPNGSTAQWSYYNSEGEWLGCEHIVKAWKQMFNPKNALDAFCGRGTFIAYMRDFGIEAYGFDFSEFAISNPYPRCRREWLKLHDGTKRWPYRDKEFDLVVMLDAYEHIYVDDLDFVIGEMYRVARKWVFLQIAVVGGGSGVGRHERGYILKKGEPIPAELEANAVAGHVTVQPASFWYKKLDRDNVLFRRDLVEYFKALVPQEVIRNWVQNLILVVEVLP